MEIFLSKRGKIFIFIFLALIAIIATSIKPLINIKRTLVSRERGDDYQTGIYGYKVEQYIFRKGVRLTFWNTSGLLFQYDGSAILRDPSCDITEIVEEKWISSGDAAYLKLKLKYYGSMSKPGTASVIFDFRRSQIYLSSDLPLWRYWSRVSPDQENDWLTEEQFQDILNRYERR
jgi:hypothetical protein